MLSGKLAQQGEYSETRFHQKGTTPLGEEKIKLEKKVVHATGWVKGDGNSLKATRGAGGNLSPVGLSNQEKFEKQKGERRRFTRVFNVP